VLQIPDLLHAEPRLGIDYTALAEILGMAFLGREMGTQLHDVLASASFPSNSWRPEFFAEDLFIRRLVRDCLRLEIAGRFYPVHQEFLFRALVHTPTDTDTVRFRQGVLEELGRDQLLRDNTYRLYRDLFDLMSLMKTPGYGGQLDVAAFHLDILKQARIVIDTMAEGFGTATSGLRRLHESGHAIQSSGEYATLQDLLDYESGMARMSLDVTIGGDGRIRNFSIRNIQESAENRFHHPPFARLMARWQLALRGYAIGQRELMSRLVHEVFRQLSPALVPLVQLIGHLELYLTARDFKQRLEGLGMPVCPANVGAPGPLELERLFNPLLMSREPTHDQTPVPCDLATSNDEPVVLITGPNSGGKTRLLQAIGIAQLLGQSGLYVPARSARLPLLNGLFVSLIEEEGAQQTEGRLGRELLRIRALFEELGERSMVILDELCSGTNPSEGVEVFTLVLRLLREVRPTAFVTTHFLDFARGLQDHPVIPGLEFLQVEVDQELQSTYQFVPGVAKTSLASLTAQRLGVTFERLARSIRRSQ
jgi:DNA mismatch repair protein MutS2